MASKKTETPEKKGVRLDKWLWAARFFKTRSLAREQVTSGKVEYNGARAKAGKIVEEGATIKLPQGYDSKTVIVKGLSEQRQAAPIAHLLYEETQESLSARADNAAARKVNAFHSPKPENRPDKKQRREIIKLKHS